MVKPDAVVLKAIAKGLVSFVPGAGMVRRKEGGGANSARYCYSVWLRHLIHAHEHGMRRIPPTVAELGPGDSLGTGLSALLSGCDKYLAFDVIHFVNRSKNLVILDELIELFSRRESIPDDDEFPNLFPRLNSYEFPTAILDERLLNESLSPNRLWLIRKALEGLGSSELPTISYTVPWLTFDTVQSESVDMIISQAVLEHVDQLEKAYSLMSRWLRPGGYMSHEIDFKSHGTARKWNGHWGYGNITWALIRGKRSYLLNRESCNTHVDLIKRFGFSIRLLLRQYGCDGLTREMLPYRLQHLTDEELSTSSAYILACKESHGHFS